MGQEDTEVLAFVPSVRMSRMGWYPIDDGKSIGKRGSEGGKILHDAELDGAARITLERSRWTGKWKCAITCGVYGWMVHTRFFGAEPEARREFGAMKDALERLVDGIPLESDPEVDSKLPAVSESISEFVRQFP